MSNMKSPLPQCASMVRIQNILSGKWKITILWYISEYEIQRSYLSPIRVKFSRYKQKIKY